jgi:hypothetical protein
MPRRWEGRTQQPRAALPPCRPAALPPCRPAALPPCRPAALPPCRPAALPPHSLTPWDAAALAAALTAPHLDSPQCVELKPDWGKGFSRLGAAYFGLEEWEEAVKAYEDGARGAGGATGGGGGLRFRPRPAAGG